FSLALFHRHPDEQEQKREREIADHVVRIALPQSGEIGNEHNSDRDAACIETVEKGCYHSEFRVEGCNGKSPTLQKYNKKGVNAINPYFQDNDSLVLLKRDRLRGAVDLADDPVGSSREMRNHEIDLFAGVIANLQERMSLRRSD